MQICNITQLEGLMSKVRDKKLPMNIDKLRDHKTIDKKLSRSVGQPKKELDRDKLYLLCQTLLPVETIAAVMECGKDVIYTQYADVLQSARENRKSSLSQAMWYAALVEKSEKMMIWLSKQHLGYRDTFAEEITPNAFTININEIPR